MASKEKGEVLWENVRDLCLDPSAREYDVVDVSDALVCIIQEIGEDELPERIATAIEEQIFTTEQGSLLIAVASYSTDDEGARIQAVLERWLEANADELRIRLALGQDTVPFRSRKRRVEVLKAVALHFPSFASRCTYFIENYTHD